VLCVQGGINININRTYLYQIYFIPPIRRFFKGVRWTDIRNYNNNTNIQTTAYLSLFLRRTSRLVRRRYQFGLSVVHDRDGRTIRALKSLGYKLPTILTLYLLYVDVILLYCCKQKNAAAIVRHAITLAVYIIDAVCRAYCL